MRAGRAEPALDLGLREFWAQERTRHAVAGGHAARLPLELVIGGERRADRATGVARRRLNPDVLELAVAQHLAVGDAIERHPAREAQIARAGTAGEAARQPQHRLF